MTQYHELMKATLEKTSIPFNKISVYGTELAYSINIEAPSEASINKWRALLSHIGEVTPPTEVLRTKGGRSESEIGWGEGTNAFKTVWVCGCTITSREHRREKGISW